MQFIKPKNLFTALAVLAIYTNTGGQSTVDGPAGIYALIGISGCMSLMFPTIYSLGITGLGEDTKIGGAGMVMAIAGAAFLTQVQGIVSDQSGNIVLAYWVPPIAFIIIAYYSGVVSWSRRIST